MVRKRGEKWKRGGDGGGIQRTSGRGKQMRAADRARQR